MSWIIFLIFIFSSWDIFYFAFLKDNFFARKFELNCLFVWNRQFLGSWSERKLFGAKEKILENMRNLRQVEMKFWFTEICLCRHFFFEFEFLMKKQEIFPWVLSIHIIDYLLLVLKVKLTSHSQFDLQGIAGA